MSPGSRLESREARVRNMKRKGGSVKRRSNKRRIQGDKLELVQVQHVAEGEKRLRGGINIYSKK